MLGGVQRRSLAQYDRDNGQPGVHLPALPGSATTYAGAARTIYERVCPSRVMSIANVAFMVGVAAAVDDTVEVGIMSAAGVRLATSGALTGRLNATGVKAVPLPIVLLPRVIYYVAMATTAPGGTAAQMCARGQSFAGCWDIAGAAVPNVECATEAAVTAIPAAMGAFSAQIAAYPNLYLRET